MNDTEKKYYNLIKDFSKTISSSLNDTDVLKMITENFTKALDVKACSVFLLSRDRDVLKLRAAHGLSDAYLNKGVLDADKSIAETLSGKPVMIYDVTKNSRVQYPEEAKEEGIASILSVPITVMGKTIGVLGLAFKPNTDDIRESRASLIIRKLLEEGAEIKAYDPKAMNNFEELYPQIEYCSSSEEVLNSDAILILLNGKNLKNWIIKEKLL